MATKKTKKNKTPEKKQALESPLKGLYLSLRLKAFITDIFMIYTPMLYIMTYAILGSAKDFRENQSAIFLCLLFYALTHSFFIAFKSQSPGMRYAQFKLVKNNRKEVGFFLALWRFILWVLSMGLLIGFVTPFIFKFFLHDKLSGTHIEIIKGET
ncbi:RDD family protein [Helicobacter pylori]